MPNSILSNFCDFLCTFSFHIDSNMKTFSYHVNIKYFVLLFLSSDNSPSAIFTKKKRSINKQLYHSFDDRKSGDSFNRKLARETIRRKIKKKKKKWILHLPFFLSTCSHSPANYTWSEMIPKSSFIVSFGLPSSLLLFILEESAGIIIINYS